MAISLLKLGMDHPESQTLLLTRFLDLVTIFLLMGIETIL